MEWTKVDWSVDLMAGKTVVKMDSHEDELMGKYSVDWLAI
jgi:hypothetical protein